MIVVLGMLLTAYAAPSFLFGLVFVSVYGGLTKKIQGFRATARKAATLTPVFAVALFVGLHGFQGLTAPHAPPLDEVTSDNFSLSNYAPSNGLTIEKTLQKIFPPGTSKNYIDSILVDKAGADSKAHTDPKTNITTAVYTHWAWPWTCFPMGGKPPTIIIRAEYDEKMTVRSWWSAKALANGCDYF